MRPSQHIAPIVGARLARLAIALACLVVGLFALTRLLGGDPVRAGLGPSAPAELVAQRRADLALDKPLPLQFARYVIGLTHGDLGRSIATGEPVAAALAPRIANTLALGGAASLLVLLGAPLGMVVAIATRDGRHRHLRASFLRGTGVVTAIPEFLLAAALISLFAVWLRLLPAAGHSDWRSFVLPMLALGTAPAALLARIAHGETDRVLREPYMLTARSKHLPTALLYRRHLLPNVMGATLTVGGMIVSGLLSGAVLIETVFAWPGLGASLVAAVTVRDYPVVQGIGLLLGLGVLLANAAIDLALALLYRGAN